MIKAASSFFCCCCRTIHIFKSIGYGQHQVEVQNIKDKHYDTQNGRG